MRLLERGCLDLADGKQDLEHRAPAGFAVDLENALVAAHDSKDGGQAETAPDELGREDNL